MKRALALLALAGCPAGDARLSTATWILGGALSGTRGLDDQHGGRVTCTVDAERESVLDPRPLITFAAVSASDGRRQPAVYFTVRDFRGAGAYHVGIGDQDNRGQVVFFDDALLAECAVPGDQRCYQSSEGCSLTVETWTLGELVPPGVKNGVGTGRFECAGLENRASSKKVSISGGRFSCRASDWTGSR